MRPFFMCPHHASRARQLTDGTKVEYRVWNPFRSKLAAAVLGGVENIYMPPGSKVLYLGGASGTTVSHVSDIVSGVDGVGGSGHAQGSRAVDLCRLGAGCRACGGCRLWQSAPRRRRRCC